MKRFLVAITSLTLLAVLAVGCEQLPSSVTTPELTTAGAAVNFRFLISDDVNDIEDFEHLYITVSSIGVREAGESGQWIVLDPEPDPDGDNVIGIDLRPLTGANALVLWTGNITPGDYDKAFIHVDNITGILADGGGTANVKLPSDKLHISKPFTVGDSVVNFVYDVTVFEAGNSGKYILKPQIGASGANQEFNDVTLPGQAQQHGAQHEKGRGNAGEQVEWFEGVITAISEGEENASPWTMTLNGVEGSVTVYVVELEGTAAVDARAEIEGVLTDNTIIDAKAEIEEIEEDE